MEFCVYLGMEQKLGNIPENELRKYTRLVMEMNGDDLYKESKTKVEQINVTEISLTQIHRKATKRLELSKDILDETLIWLMVFRQYGNSMELFTERAEIIHEQFEKMNFQRHDTLRKVEKREVFRKILLGMRRCGQVTYHEIIKSEFENSGKELIEYEL